MKGSSSKEQILKKIRQALATPVPVPFTDSEGNSSVFQPQQKELEVEFAENFTALQGKFLFCLNEKELVDQLLLLKKIKNLHSIFCNEAEIKSILEENGFNDFAATEIALADASITTCECLIARTGSILLSSGNESGRTASIYAPIHICIAYSRQLVYDIKEGLQTLKNEYGNTLPSFISLATGPSRTADIEKTLVVGVHGPKEVFVFLVEG